MKGTGWERKKIWRTWTRKERTAFKEDKGKGQEDGGKGAGLSLRLLVRSDLLPTRIKGMFESCFTRRICSRNSWTKNNDFFKSALYWPNNVYKLKAKPDKNVLSYIKWNRAKWMRQSYDYITTGGRVKNNNVTDSKFWLVDWLVIGISDYLNKK